MHFELAKTIAQTPKQQGSHSHIFDNNDAFVWAEHGDEIEQFNALAGADAGFEDIEVIANDDDADDMHSYRYKGKALTVPLVDDREDNLISVHTLAQLVKADFELRMCVDTAGNSEQAFLVLTPAQWKELEDTCSAEAVRFRFFPLPAKLDDFMEQAFADEHVRNYRD